MDIMGLDKIKKMDNNDNEEIRVTGLDFNQKKKAADEPTEAMNFDFIKKLDTDPAEQKEHGVTGLEFINQKNSSSDVSTVTGLDFISREGEHSGSASLEGLDSIKQLEFGDMGIIIHHDD